MRADEAGVDFDAHTLGSGWDGAPAGGDRSAETLVSIRDDVRRERLLDMELRVRRYRLACFAILAVALALGGSDAGWWWLAPLAAGFAGFAVADRFMRSASHPAVWIAAAWSLTPLLLGGAVLVTGAAASPVLVWFALPAVTLGARFEPRGMAAGTAFILLLFVATAVLPDPAAALQDRQALTAVAALILSTVILSAALAESDRAHRSRSTLDPLTGLYNRGALEQRLAEMERQARGPGVGLPPAMLLCDVDHFKRVNDRLGHAAGDSVLREIADTMRSVLRAGDSIYRVGGEEILVILPGAARADAIKVGERLRRAVRERRPVGVRVTISVGAAVANPGPLDADDLVARADAALYAAKAGGRDTVFCAN